MNHNNSILWKRGAVLAGVLALSAGELLAQGVSPWLDAVQVLEGAFTGPIAQGTGFDCHCRRRAHVRLWRGRFSKKALAGIIFGLGMAMGAAQFSELAVLMERHKTWRGYPALSKPLTILGVERRWFLLSATLGLAMWNLTSSPW